MNRSALFLLALPLACTPPKTVDLDPACAQEDTQVDPSDGTGGSTVAWLGSVRLTETRDAVAGNGVTASVAATFYDVTGYSVTNPTPTPGMKTATCFAFTGQPSQNNSPTAMPITRVDINGMLGGARTLSNPDGGSLSLSLIHI